MAMTRNPARRGVSLLLFCSSSCTIPIACRIPQHRFFASTPTVSAFASTSNFRTATSTTTAAKPTSTTTAKPTSTTTAKPTSTTTVKPTSTTATKPSTTFVKAAPTTTTSSTTATKPSTTFVKAAPTTATAPRTVTPSFPTNDPPPPTARSTSVATANTAAQKQRSLTEGLSDTPPELEGVPAIDWTRSYYGLGDVAFSPEQQDILLAPIESDDVEVKPDGIIYLPEIKYRRILNKAFGPGGWGLAPRGESIVTAKLVTREYGLVVQGRLVSIARGEQQYFDADGIPTATEGCKSNSLMRCCKDLGIASELWDPRFIRSFHSDFTKEVWVEHATTKKKRKMVLRKDDTVKYPFKETKMSAF